MPGPGKEPGKGPGKGPGHGPGHGPGKGPKGFGPKVENPGKLMKRLMGYVMRDFAIHWIVVIICIVGGVLASVQGTLFTRT